MENEIIFSVSLTTILTSALVAFLAIVSAAVIRPSIHVLRDIVLWKVIDKHISTEKILAQAEKHERYKIRLSYQFKYRPYVAREPFDSEPEMEIAGQPVDLHDAIAHEKIRQHLTTTISKVGADLDNRERRINTLLKHFGLDNFKNPITHHMNTAKELYLESPPDYIDTEKLFNEEDIKLAIERVL
ncbi:hypothetical protein IEI94_05280 [Halomonas sp. ML-15]|uniref:hypothetical protein n=1 Tax=Halomonas sp. ML-15 TaxID=2773305 RepID=UPI001745F2DE|nr:hypothetical protein [Halomonas sp. ML-15]MBD3895259.1 hypothetical protein [Halomonas sp. ML-15]